MNVGKGTFIPLVLSGTVGIGKECSVFFKKLIQLNSIKRKQELSMVTYGIRSKIISNNEYEKLNEISFNPITIVKRN